jgi:SAM-dependent methyltransferase
MSDLLAEVKRQKWFYEFPLPDGSRTESYLDAHFRGVHATRERALRRFLAQSDCSGQTALDVACHEGFFTIALADYFEKVVGIDKNADSLGKASQIAKLLGKQFVDFRNQSLEAAASGSQFDFVLCFGLLYHVENPLEVFRALGCLARQAICIETQVLPFEVEGSVEDGSFIAQRPVQGLFAVCQDYSRSKEGGLTDMALVPSRRALEYCLASLGFTKFQTYSPEPCDYEQFVRGHRVILLAER